MIRLLFLSFALSYSFSSYSINIRVPVSTIKKDCNLKKSGVEDYRDLVQKVGIRKTDEEAVGKEDSRVVSSQYKASFPMGCERLTEGKEKSGTINYIGNNRAVSVLHTILDLETCKPRVKMDKCFFYDGSKIYPLKWKGNPVEICQNNPEQDAVIVAEIIGENPGVNPYKIKCSDEINLSEGEAIKVVGSIASNYKGPAFKFGKENLVGKGKVFRSGTYQNQGYVTYDVDTGKGTSGGALVINEGGEDYLVGVHRGDWGLEYLRSATKGQEVILPADKTDNYGQGILFGTEVLGCK